MAYFKMSSAVRIYKAFVHRFYINKKYKSSYSKDDASIFNAQKDILNLGSLLSISDLKGNIIYVNDKFCEVSKYTAEELMGKPHNIIRHPDTPSCVFKEMWGTIGVGKVWQGEIKNKDKEGNPYWVFATISPVIGENGKPVKYISMRQDITQQKLVTEELVQSIQKNDIELFENVSYAKRIHNTFLTSAKILYEIFPESFLIYNARKIVSGDFYLVKKNKNQSVIILGDSTGHGVSASYISIMILNILNNVMKMAAHCPARVLENLHKEILNTTSSDNAVQIIESADMAFCLIDHEKMTMEYAFAKMRGFIIRDGEIVELERDSCSVGDHKCGEIKIKKHLLNLKKGDSLYLYTDGVIDQFGGVLDKKFGTKQLRNVLMKHCSYSMEQQREFITDILTHWQGNNEQTDDISLLGIKII